jgi:pyochelin biosynthetic protein PchC
VPQAEPRQRLVCLPHAGGSAAFFRDWGRELAEYEVYAVRYPGRAERIDEASPSDLRALARDVADAVAPLADVPIALFGHSMGAAVALETARQLEARGISLLHLFASGSRNAPCPKRGVPVEEDAATVVARLVRLGGTDAELAADPVFQELILPYIVSDGRMFHAYDMAPEPVLCCPVTVIVGDADEDADRRPWAELTMGPFLEAVVSGDHFYLITEPPFPLLRSALDSNNRASTP